MTAQQPVIDLTGKIAMVTGASGGQGRVYARLMHSLGATLVLTDLNESDVQALAAEIGNGAMGLAHDVSSSEAWQDIVDVIEREHGRLDVLVNNAGLCVPASLQDTDESMIRATININLVGAILGMKIMLPLMQANGGSIVNIASTAGLKGYENLVHYAASKWGLIGASRSTAIEYGKYGIRVNSVCPGAVDTPMATPDTREGRGFITRIPVPRVGRPEEIANMVVFLASDASSYCTGHEFTVDGGQAA